MPFLLNASSMAKINVCNWLMPMEKKTFIMENEGSLWPCIFRLDRTKDRFFFSLINFLFIFTYRYFQLFQKSSLISLKFHLWLERLPSVSHPPASSTAHPTYICAAAALYCIGHLIGRRYDGLSVLHIFAVANLLFLNLGAKIAKCTSMQSINSIESNQEKNTQKSTCHWVAVRK